MNGEGGLRAIPTTATPGPRVGNPLRLWNVSARRSGWPGHLLAAGISPWRWASGQPRPGPPACCDRQGGPLRLQAPETRCRRRCWPTLAERQEGEKTASRFVPAHRHRPGVIRSERERLRTSFQCSTARRPEPHGRPKAPGQFRSKQPPGHWWRLSIRNPDGPASAPGLKTTVLGPQRCRPLADS